MSALALKAYRSAAVDVRCTDADKRDLVIMMYDGAIEAIRLARAHAERTERRSVSASVSRALAILNGLRETLDVQKGGSVASHLDDFYQFFNPKAGSCRRRGRYGRPRRVRRLAGPGSRSLGVDQPGDGGAGQPTDVCGSYLNDAP